MQPKKFSEYTPISDPGDNDIVPILHDGNNSATQLKDLPVSDPVMELFDGIEATPDATTTVKGKIRLANDLSGTADNPSVSGLYLTNESGTPVDIGGISAGTTFSNEPVKDIINALLYPYQSPAFSSFAISGQSTSVEVGTTISGNKTFTWGTTNSSNVETSSILIRDESADLGTGLANDGSETLGINPVQLTTPGSYTWGIEAENTESGTFGRDFTVNWLWRRFSGTSTNTTLTEAQIEALVGNTLASSGLATYSLAAGGYKFICYPATLTAASLFTDTQTGFDVSMATVADNAAYSNTANGYSYALVSVTNGLGQTTNYRVYRTKFQLGSSINIRVD